jgi:hypothetical protein
MDMHNRIQTIRTRIEDAARRSGRSGKDIVLVGVSKTVDAETACQAYNLGIKDLGENRVQELNHKLTRIPDARWHMIGRLQTNKVKDVVGRVVLIHSLDRWNLAEEINKRGQYLGLKVPALLEINISGESQKAGLCPNDVEPFLQSVGQLPALVICGFMTMAPESPEPETSRPVFRELNSIFKSLQNKDYRNVDLRYLSMGMSQDFEVAIEEGAHIVRIGSALFSA